MNLHCKGLRRALALLLLRRQCGCDASGNGGGEGGGVLAGLLFRKVPARALHLTLGALILLGGVRLLLC